MKGAKLCIETPTVTVGNGRNNMSITAVADRRTQPHLGIKVMFLDVLLELIIKMMFPEVLLELIIKVMFSEVLLELTIKVMLPEVLLKWGMTAMFSKVLLKGESK